MMVVCFIESVVQHWQIYRRMEAKNLTFIILNNATIEQQAIERSLHCVVNFIKHIGHNRTSHKSRKSGYDSRRLAADKRNEFFTQRRIAYSTWRDVSTHYRSSEMTSKLRNF